MFKWSYTESIKNSFLVVTRSLTGTSMDKPGLSKFPTFSYVTMQNGSHFDQKINNAWSSRWHLSYTPVKSSWHKQVLQHKAVMWKQAEEKKNPV